ncbi:AI-2E family transporter [Chroococcidiopsis sp. CCALA 051]|uniref:AI-2E family transporter n=1 Tax=Chroococcidiopsis sp. CCALA 051 TaxID=869949 RepID=UPI000D0D1060|nr:AI-2E family transporter [Chroococcidiopsis sp. CCALA 051]MBE9014575.1 AI-2E family transporter [Chroococcidiopsidales cyanobacterium LEGE 13417]PSM48938.1 AI-2E family transporter [Chroococcidiopsis sp. CCALA 051]
MGLGQWIGLVVFVVCLYISWQIRQVLLLIFTAVVLAIALNRLVRLFQRFRIGRSIAIFLSVGLLLLLLAGFFIVVIPPFLEQLQELVKLTPEGLERLRSWTSWLQNLIPEQVVQDLRNLSGLTQQLQSLLSSLFGNFLTLFSNSIGIILNCVVVLVLTIMLLANPAPYRRSFILLFPSSYRHRVEEILQQCEVGLGGWVTGILFNMAIIAVLNGTALLILQVPLALANGVLSGISTFVPNVGPFLSTIPAVLLALLDSPGKAVAVLVAYIIIQQVESNVLTPLIMKRQVSLLPAVTLASQLIFASFFGFLGLFLALPLLVITQVWIKELLVKDVLNKR